MSSSVVARTGAPPTALSRGTIIFLPRTGLGLIRCRDGRVVTFLESSVVGTQAVNLRLGDDVRIVERCGTPDWVETVVVMRRRMT